MMDRRPKVCIDFEDCDFEVMALVDTGASRSFIGGDLWRELASKNYEYVPYRMEFGTASQSTSFSSIGYIILEHPIFGRTKFLVCPHLSTDMILGNDTLQKNGCVIDYVDGVIRVDDGKEVPLVFGQQFTDEAVCSSKVEMSPEGFHHIDQHPVFRNQLGHCKVGDPLRIRSEGPPIKQRAYRQPLVKRQIVDEEINRMLELGVIRPSQSPWASPITLVNKKDGTVRFCVDYRRINAATEKDAYPIPNIQELFDTLQGAQVFTTLDLKSGYWQVDLHPDDIEKTAFVCHRGLFEFTRLPFGLVNAPGQFQRLMSSILSEHLGRTCLVYIDDIVVFSKDKDAHRADVQKILDTIHDAGLTLKLKKCFFCKEQVELLGYTVSASGISPQEDKVAVIRDMSPPEDLKAVQRFLGMTGYYRQTIPGYASLAEPLVRLTKKGEPWCWKEEQDTAFRQLREELTSDRVMAFPHTELPYKLYTDASNYAVGAILAQDQDGIERPIHYVSKQLTEGQKKWSAIEREAYAIIYALQKL
jgi:hypothetical protein